MIGLSLSACVKDICTGKVTYEQVEKIISATALQTQEDIEYMLQSYCESYWKNFPSQAEMIALRLMSEGKVTQPRLEGKPCPDIRKGHWVNKESEIKWLV